MDVHFLNDAKRILVAVLAVFILLAMPAGALAQAGGPSDPVEMEAFFDGIMLSHLEADHIPGVTVVVVKDGEIFFSKGYGYADVEQEIAVDPARTLFRIGSASKLFTWTAVMQLVEQGLLDLDADVNDYLDFEIPATYSQPITMRHLLTHTPGFEDCAFDVLAPDAESLRDNRDWMKTHIPARMWPAGTLSAYSNYGTALAGYIVERISGMPFADYLEEHITGPLGMARTTIRQPLPEGLAGDMAQGYQFVGARPMVQDFQLMRVAPAGAISATGEDMARFMIAHLQGGRYADAQILQEATAQQMHSPLFTHDERINGMAYGFFEEDRNGQRIVGHGGDLNAYHTQLSLLPDEDLGFFISCNSGECAGFPRMVLTTFMDHYYPLVSTVTPTLDFAERAKLITGRYRMNRMAYTNAEKFTMLLAPMKFTVQDGALLWSPENMYLEEVEPFVFQQRDGDFTLVFSQDDQGKVTRAFIDGLPIVFERVPALDTPLLHYVILGSVVVFALSVLAGGPLVFLIRWLRSEPQPALPNLARAARWVLGGAFVMCVGFLGLVMLVLLNADQALLMGQLPFEGAWGIIFALIVLLALAALGFTVLVWKNRYWNLFARVHYTLATLVAWSFVWFVNYWHLLRW